MSDRRYKAAVILVVVAVIVVGGSWKLHSRTGAGDAGPSTVAESAQDADAGGDAATADAAASSAPDASAQQGSDEPVASGKSLPAVIDLGMGKCIPCKAMKPILDELADEYRGRARIDIIDVGDHPEEADRYRVMIIPTQVFIDADGEEVYRHEGFMPKEDIVAKLAEMGVE